MRKVTLKRVKLLNFKSYLDEMVELTGAPGLLYLGGSNQKDLDLGSNGAGKSTLWDAIRWCWYGSIGKKSTISSLVTWGQEKTDVTTFLEVDGVEYSISRSGPPVKSYINGQQVEQLEIDRLLGLSRARFEASVIFGQAQPLFSDRSIPERGELLDEVLGLGIWQNAADAASQKSIELEKAISEEQKELRYIEGQLTALPSKDQIEFRINEWEKSRDAAVESLLKTAQQWELTHEARLSELRAICANWKVQQEARIAELKQQEQKQKDAWLDEVDRISQEVEQETAQLRNPSEANELRAQAQEHADEACKIQGEITTLQNENASTLQELGAKAAEKKALESGKTWWLVDREICPTCLQKVDSRFREEKLKETEAALRKIDQDIEVLKMAEHSRQNLLAVKRAEHKKETEQAVETYSRIQWEEKKQADQQRRIDSLKSRALSILEQVEAPKNEWTVRAAILQNEQNPNLLLLTNLEKETNPNLPVIEAKKLEANPHRAELVRVLAQALALEAQWETKNAEVTKMMDYKASVDYWKHGFKNIRLFFTEKVLAALQIEVGNAISTLGLQGWKVQLSTETETKSGTLKLGVQIQVASPSSNGFVLWESWSGGETQRLRLAIAMGLASLILRASGVVYSFETWDEPSAWLSVEGIEDLLTVLDYRAQALQKRLWLVDHNALTYSGFSEMWQVTKNDSGSHLQKLTSEG